MKTRTFPGTLDSLAPVRDFAKAEAVKAGLSEKAVYKLILAIDEMVTNSINYGYVENDLAGDIVVSAEIAGDEFIVRFKDTAPAFDPRQASLPTEEGLTAPLEERAVGGLGIFLSLREVDRFDYRRAEGSNVYEFAMKLN